jgi:hypothetical protein
MRVSSSSTRGRVRTRLTRADHHSCLRGGVTTQPGASYTFSVTHSPTPGTGPITNKFQIYFNDTKLATITRGATGLTQPPWQTSTFTVTGTGSDRISFRDTDTNTVGALIDDVRLVAN